MRAFVSALLALFALDAHAELWPSVFPGGGGSGSGSGGASMQWGIEEAEPDITVDYVWQANQQGIDQAWNTDAVPYWPVRGQSVIRSFSCIYDGTVIIGADDFTICLASATTAGGTSCISGTSITFVNSAIGLDYIQPTSMVPVYINSSSTDVGLTVRTTAKTDAGAADDSTLAASCVAVVQQLP